jgi:threonine dehydratase
VEPTLTLDGVRACRDRIAPYVLRTPVHSLADPQVAAALPDVDVWLKLELLQRAGTFKPRGALSNMLDLDAEALARGVTAVSAGNHAMAVGYAAAALGSTAKVVMPKNANPGRVAGCRAYGAEVVLVDDVHAAFEEVHRIEREEGRTFVHPFDGHKTVRGTATLGLELCEQIDQLDAVVVPIGGGGLAAGVAWAVKQLRPSAKVYGVEPAGADTMRRSIDAGEPQSIDAVRTIADSLGAPYAVQYSFEVCRDNLDDVVLVDDDQLKSGMGFLLERAKLAVEPAGAATTAALLGPLKSRVKGHKVAAIVCGANIDVETFCGWVAPPAT